MRVIRALPHAAGLLGLAGLLGCAAGGSPSPSVVSVSAGVQRLDVSVKGSTVTPKPAQVDIAQGETLELVVTSDHDDELHAHGFDGAEAELRAGVPTTVRLTATETGSYEVETHHPALLLLTVAVR